MKTLILLLLLAMASRAQADDSRILHDSTHFLAGEFAGLGVQACNRATGMDKSHPLLAGILVLAVPIFLATAKEDSDQIWSWEEWSCTTLGGVSSTFLTLHF